MKRAAAIILFAVVLAAIVFVQHRGHAEVPPLPSTLQTTGYGPYESPLIQPKQSPWTVTLDYTPLNNSASVTILNQNRNIVGGKLVAAAARGSVVYQGQGTDPMYVEAYAGNWSVSLSY